MSIMIDHTKRLDNVRAELKKAGFSQIIVTEPAAIFYLTGEKVFPFERTWALYINTDKKAVLFANKLFSLSDAPLVPVVWHTDTDEPADSIYPEIDHDRPLGIDKKMAAGLLLSLQEMNAAKGYKNLSFTVDAVRGSKSPEEQELMREASRINDMAMARFKSLIHEGVTEIEVASQIEGIYQELGAEGNSFTPIVCFGATAADPHHEPDNTVIKPGDAVLFDVGCIKNGYCSDMTRTFFYKEVSDEHRKLYEIVKEANLAGEAAMGFGKRFCDADAAARNLITNAGYGEYFTHRLGHSIGTEVHEAGDVGARNDALMNAGRCVSCEPGIYLPGNVGIRIEDLVLITETETVILNSYSKELEIIG